MWPNQSSKLNTKLFINKETVAIKLNRNTTLLKTFIKYLVRKGAIISLLKDRAYNIKLDTILKKDSKEDKNDNAAKSKDNIFNTSTTLEKYINFTTIVKKGENRSYFKIINLVTNHTKKKL